MFWLIMEETEDASSPLSVDLPGNTGEGALAVFSFKEEAQAYLRLGAPRGRWRIEEVEAMELASMLLWGACSGVGWVALDPMPELSGRSMIALLSMNRKDFLGLLSSLARAEPRMPTASMRSGAESETRRQ